MRPCILMLILCVPGCLSLHGAPGRAKPTLLATPYELPRELSKTTLPDYTIEPPDILRIEVSRLIPKSPYLLGPGDGLLVQATRPDGTQVIDQVLTVELDGTVQLGSPFDDPNTETDPALKIDGPNSVVGLSVADAKALAPALRALRARCGTSRPGAHPAPDVVPAGARISAGKSGNVARSLPWAAVVTVNWSPVICMPSPESPANRTTTSSRVWTGRAGVSRSGGPGFAGHPRGRTGYTARLPWTSEAAAANDCRCAERPFRVDPRSQGGDA